MDHTHAGVPGAQTPAMLAGRYRLRRRLGAGGMAEVYLADDELLGRQVAVKVLRRQFAQDEEFVGRFEVEARAAALLCHPGIVAVYDRGHEDGVWFIAMEYVPGETLRDRLRREGPLRPADAVRIAAEVLSALAAAHAQHIVHRDVTPSNVLLDPDGRVRVADFGIARIGPSSLTRTGAMLGTSLYLSPEQAQGKPADERSDLYSLGVVLFEMLAGRPPFTGDADVAVALKHVQEPAPDVRDLAPAVPAALAAVLARALAKDADERYQDAAGFAAALRAAAPPAGLAPARHPATDPVAGRLPVPRVPDAQPTRLAPDAQPTRVAAEGPTALRPPAPRRRRRWLLIAAVAAVAAVAGVVGVVSYAGAGTEVPDVTGRSRGAAVAALRAEGLRPVVHREFSDLAGEGLVARQAPAAGAAADDGERVDVWVSEGPVTIPAPDLVGKTSSAARDALEQAVLDGERHRQAHNSAAPGTVFKQVPAAGVTVARGDTVAYYISLGRPRVAVPDVIGLSAGDAQAALEELGLVAAVDLVAGWGDVPGSVVGQDPAPGERLRVGSEVVLSVAVF